MSKAGCHGLDPDKVKLKTLKLVYICCFSAKHQAIKCKSKL